MSRASGVGALLSGSGVSVLSVEPTGDCFYEAIAAAAFRERAVDDVDRSQQA